ncbi:MAG: hypothetical protein KDA75_02785 [Planctomycetaceae bacterium]|nr:hypothetical protein [Planctomycetaceae bacterium]
MIRQLLSLSLILVLTCCGCFGGAPADAPETAPVKGKVTRKGAPLVGVSVSFQPLDAPEGKSNPSNGFTDEQGNYEMILNRSTMGVVPGRHRVRLTAQDGVDDEDESKKAPDEVVIPIEVGTLEVTVPPEGLDGGDANFDLDF